MNKLADAGRHCRLEEAGLQVAVDWVEEVRGEWNARLDRLDDYLKKLQGKEPTDGC